MRPNNVRQIIESDRIAFGAYTGSITDPAIVEIIAQAGYDAAFIDMEHAPIDYGAAGLLIRAADSFGITPVVRVESSQPSAIGRVLDAGAQVVFVPHVHDASTARSVSGAARFPPLGTRGMNPQVRAASYGGESAATFAGRSNEQILIVGMIEDAAGVENAASIAATAGIDVIAIGPSDLSSSLGIFERAGEDPLERTVRAVAAEVRRAGKVLAFPFGHARMTLDVTELHALGVRYCNCGPWPEKRLLKSFADQLEVIREQVAMNESQGQVGAEETRA